MKKKLLLAALFLSIAAAGLQVIGIPRIVKGSIADAGEVKVLPRTMDETISDFIEQNTPVVPGGKNFESHKLYGTVENDGIIYAYIWSYTGDYFLEGKTLKQGAAQNLPLTVVLKKGSQGEYIPLASFEYSASKADAEKLTYPKAYTMQGSKIKSESLSFPKNYQSQINGVNGFEALGEIVKQKAMNYYNVKAEDISGKDSDKENAENTNASAPADTPAASPATTPKPASMPSSSSPASPQAGEDTTVNLKTDCGKYIGRIDNNSIEIRIIGVQDEAHAYRAFRLTEELKSRFDQNEFSEGDMILVTYYTNAFGQNILQSVEKIVNK